MLPQRATIVHRHGYHILPARSQEGIAMGEGRYAKLEATAKIDRREFLKYSTAAGLTVLGLPGEVLAAEPHVRRYRKLGRTGLEISDVSFGSSRTGDPVLVRRAYERGVNYFDSAESYKGGRSELAIGQALKDVRDKVVITSKVKCHEDSSRQELMTALEESLGRLQTDRVDIYFNHAVNDVDRLKNQEWHEFAELAKKQGKLRFTGMSGHGARLIECLDYALDRDLFDVVLCAYNFGQDPTFLQRLTRQLGWVGVAPEIPRALAKAHEKGVGVVAMKTLRGAKLSGVRENGSGTFAQAALSWVFSNPNVDALVISMTSLEEVDEYLGASGTGGVSGAQLDLLEQYLLASRESYCNHGCSSCQTSCPYEVSISEVLRTRMYAAGYHDLPYAREEYAKLEPSASACASCALQTCAQSCPLGLDIAALTRSAHSRLA
jgi:predicted aldo/keto reductase-like oxidoreductase